jgi:hypothetical protein
VPTLFIGSVGVYDIEHHYTYEWWRGVSELSTMKQAFKGREHFAQYSPQLIFPELRDLRACTWLQSTLDGVPENERRRFGEVQRRLGSVALEGDVISQRVGYQTPRGAGHGDMVGAIQARLPAFVLLTSGHDQTVPWHTTVAFHKCALSFCIFGLVYCSVSSWFTRGKDVLCG